MSMQDVMLALRLQQVKRYPICSMNREQSVAEHTMGVVVIARYLADAANDRDLMGPVVDYAIVHDGNEVFTGDIPSSFKRVLREHYPGVTLLLDGPKPPKIVEQIVKLADYIEAVYYMREFGGSRLANGILNDIVAKYREYHAVLWDDSGFPHPILNRSNELMTQVQMMEG